MSLPKLATLPITPGQVLGILILLGIVAANLRSSRSWYHLPRWEHALGFAGLITLVDGQYLGLVDAPAERMMGEVGRILYVHVPAAWSSLVCFFFATVFAVAYLLTSRDALDALVEACAEVGVVLASLLLVTGSIFARPTWGTWWTWDPRLTSSAVMAMSFLGVLLLRQAVPDPDRRATWTSVTTILAATSMVVTYFSVRWWNSIHQMQSSPDTIAPEMTLILRINGFAFLFLAAWMVTRRWRLGMARLAAERPPSLDEVQP